MNFLSDNNCGATSAILQAIISANEGTDSSYGSDAWSARVEQQLRELFGKEDLVIAQVITGTAANALALSALTPPHGAVLCTAQAHINTNECGAPEFFTGGAKMIPVQDCGPKLNEKHLRSVFSQLGLRGFHEVRPATVSITQATEAGTVYAPDEIAAIAQEARRHDCTLHMDGARFANALVALGCEPADISWRPGVDVLSLGATKNGAMAAETVIFFDPNLARASGYRRKRAGHLLAKMRFVSSQLEAYFANDHWLENALHANAMASELANAIQNVPNVELLYPVQTNQLFVRMPASAIESLDNSGVGFCRWPYVAGGVIRLVTSYATTHGEVKAFIELLHKVMPD